MEEAAVEYLNATFDRIFLKLLGSVETHLGEAASLNSGKMLKDQEIDDMQGQGMYL